MATFNVSSSSDLRSTLKYIEARANVSLKAVGDKVKEEVQDYIQKNLYNQSGSDYYDRTMQYLNSVDVKVTGNNSVEIYFDTSKISPSFGSEGKWSQHQSMSDGSDVSDLIPEFMEFGVSGSLHDREGIYAIENSIEIAEQTKYHLHEMVKQLASVGIVATLV